MLRVWGLVVRDYNITWTFGSVRSYNIGRELPGVRLGLIATINS